MTLKKLTAGDGYTYLTRHIAGGDVDWQTGQSAADYYNARGNPPGRWGGRGLDQLGLSGTVTETQMRNLFGEGLHPEAESIIAAYLAANTKPGMSDEQLEVLSQKAAGAAALGRRFPVYATLDAFETRVERQLAVIRTETGREPTQAEVGKTGATEARRARAAVAGYDLVFTPQKSLVLLWALDERQWVRDAVLDAHERARDSALALLEEHAAYTRTGDVGQAQIETRGLIYTVFDHFDSRDGDPNLHTHVPVSNKICGVDGKWRSLDGSALYRLAVTASEHYNTQVELLATESLGLEFGVRADTAHKRHPVREVIGLPVEWIRGFSQRRAQIEARYEQLIVDFRRAHGRDPEGRAAFSLAERANLDTRGPKPSPRSLAELRAEWADRFTAGHGRSAWKKLASLVTVTGPEQRPARLSTALSTADISALAQQTVGHAEQSRSTWTAWNLRTEADRILRDPSKNLFPDGIVFATRAERVQVLERVVTEAVHTVCLPVTVEPDLREPAALRRSDGESVFTAHRGARFTSREILDAEQRLLHAASTPVTTGLNPLSVRAALDGYEAVHGTTLDAGQRHMVLSFATDARQIAVGLGPAGAGKTTTMHAYQHVLAAHGVRLIPLATSAAAAAVLSADLGVAAENTHKFVYEHLQHQQPSTGPNSSAARPLGAFFQVGPGDVILVDEAGLAGTRNLDTIREIADRHGATIRLLGDHRQLGAVESGGALRLLAHEAGAVELTVLHRFTDPAEATATLALRDGDNAALDFYADHSRIRGGSAEAMIEQAYNAWQADMSTGQRTLMLASTLHGTTALSARARADRIAAGQVEADGADLHDGNKAGRGDWIVTRDNHRQLTCNRGKDWVRNGDAWTVTARHSDGSLKVRHTGHGGTLTLPADYVATQVELLYATTVHRAQGATVDTTHALVTDDMTRENLYVAATRAKTSTTLYAVTHQVLPLDEDQRVDRTTYDRHSRAAREVLETVLGREGAELSATEAIAKAEDDARSLATLAPRLRYSAEIADGERLRALVSAVLPGDAAVLAADPEWTTAQRALRSVEAQGWDLKQVLAGTARRGPLADADNPARLLAWRVRDVVDGRTPTPELARPSTTDAERYAALLRPLVSTDTTFDPNTATSAPRILSTDPITGTTDHQALLALIIGDDDAQRAAAEPAWPALTAAVRRAEHAGHEPLSALAQAVMQRPLDDARSLSQVLAYRLGHTLTEQPVPVTEPDSDAWRALAWTLKAAENNGIDANTLLATVQPGGDLHALRQHVHHLTAPAPQQGVLPWENPLPQPTPAASVEHLTTTEQHIADRLADLTRRAVDGQPAWVTALGPAPAQADEYAVWHRQVEIVAAFRDQHQITVDKADQPLGAYVPTDSAMHEAYLRAADAVLTAYHLDLEPADPVNARISADVFSSLPDDQRTAVTRATAERLGDTWLGPLHGDADTLLTAPAYAAHLHHELIEQGLLDAICDPSQTVDAGRYDDQIIIRQLDTGAPMEHQLPPEPGIQITW
ncbi:MobF family relaxase [Longispora sp. NPDC051575]|uniref:MobF family relaxase n=1 Tax=Longispora sp. NPDC051575 TaxID=3154943 RepID=UPI0034222D48